MLDQHWERGQCGFRTGAPFQPVELRSPWISPNSRRTGLPMATITKKDLVERIADETEQTQVMTKRIIQRFLDAIVEELSAGNRLEFREFGVFETKERKSRRARNPRTGEDVPVEAKTVVTFKAGRMMKNSVQRRLDRAKQILAEEAASQPPPSPRSEGGAGSPAWRESGPASGSVPAAPDGAT